MIDLTIVVPCFNEESVLPETVSCLLACLEDLENKGKVSVNSHLCLVDDGSQDKTWSLIEDYATETNRVRGIKLTRNRGHQNALLAGLLTADGDAIVSIDADLQDDTNVIEEMIDHFLSGKQIVYGVREERSSDTFFKRTTARCYYRLLRIFGVDIVMHHADFRLLGRPALNALKEYGEVNIFLRGIMPTIGFPTAEVNYARQERLAGETRYTFRKMLSLAIDGITSFSALPLRIIAGGGLLIFLLSLALSGWVLWIRLVADNVVPGWASSVLPMYLLGGIQLFSIGVLGEYVAKTYLETKRRPRFLIEKIIP